jgi:MGT family glycosyltransferase
MPSVLAFTFPDPGHLFPLIPILLELERRGNKVLLAIVAEHNSTAEELAASTSLKVTYLRAPAANQEPSAGIRTQVADRLALFASRGEAMARLLDGCIAAHHPTFLLIDPVLWGASIAAEASGLPWASVGHNPLTIRALGLDVRGPGYPPPSGAISRAKLHAIDFVRGLLDSYPLELVNAVRTSRGLRPLSRMKEQFFTPPVTLALTAPPFEYPREDWAASLHFVGPIFWEPPSRRPEWLDTFDDRPLILVAGSSQPETGPSRDWISCALNALAGEAVQVVATIPAGDAPKEIPLNARVTRFIPHEHLIPRSSCVVCHGGAGVTMKALAAGVPVVAIPFSHDRFEIARRVEVAGAGVMLPGRRLTPQRLREATALAMARRKGAETISQAFTRVGGATAAADIIEGTLR